LNPLPTDTRTDTRTEAASSAQQSLTWLLAMPPSAPVPAAPSIAPSVAPSAVGAPASSARRDPAAPDDAPLREHRHPLANRDIVLNGVRIAYHHAHAKRRSIGMSVSPQGVQVRAPRWVTQAQVQAVLRERGDWILSKLHLQLARAASQAPAQRWGAGHTVPVLGRAVLLRAQGAQPNASRTAPVKLVRWLSAASLEPGYSPEHQQNLAKKPNTGQLELNWAQPEPADARPTALEATSSSASLGSASLASTSQANSTPLANAPFTLALDVALPADAPEAQWQAAVLHWLQTLARRHFTTRLDQLAPVLGVRWSRLSLTNARTRWGSASSDGSIRLHWRLMQLQPELADYVIVHELAHLHEMNHSPRFWAIVQAAMPDYARHQQALKQIRLAPD
jgi:hypothetical protein